MKFTASMFADLALTAHDPDAAKKAAAILNGTLEPDAVLQRGWMLPADELKLEALNELLDCYGVESYTPEGEMSPAALYLNAGNMYNETVLLDEFGEFHLMPWGDFVEAYEREAEEV